ncbi:non-ribosomal peptide synthetase [Lachnobacterium bovis]|uniref:Amino acid adenylation domain-containing protein n=1 Tax=Lachnobacterium bovis DSM 14045 TaxID=1122142 RepID=A0A1H3KJ46_9FIRM|nr:non-ribosomal peptide synthetase [Lachnobacterium bovis]SDY51668.1 amino acid adenylation domain-containing protein [Lachnobacterium bovis DSM 14045]
MKQLAKYLLESAKAGKIDKAVAAKVVMALSKNEKKNSTNEYAIVGMNGEFALGENLEQYHSILKNGVDCVRDFPEERKEYAKKYLDFVGANSDIEFVKGGFLENIADFDYEFFGISPAEAKLMDPNQRRFLQTAWNCLEDAGYGASQLNGKNVGVFVGYDNSSINEYKKLVTDVNPEAAALSVAGNIIPVIASRISYICDYHGPSSIFDTACSSSGVALYFACLAIESGECDSAIVGSSRICMVPAAFNTKVGVEAGDWKAKAFDDSADGTGVGEGVGAIYIKKLKDAIRDKDDIYCVIKSVAINCDGDSNGITAPNPDAQAVLISHNIKKANIEADSISYFEAHGTGTKLGDPIEIEGITKAIGSKTKKQQFCAIGSSKTNIGHLDHASTMASIIKSALSLKNKELYPSLHFKMPNRLIDFSSTPVYLNTEYKHWEIEEGKKRRLAINAFGLSGTNVNIILEEYNEKNKTIPNDIITKKEIEDNQFLPITISAKSEESFKARISNMIYYLEESNNSLADICYTLFKNEGKYKYKFITFASNKDEAIKSLAEYEEQLFIQDEDYSDERQLKRCLDNLKKASKEHIKYVQNFFDNKELEYDFPEDCHRVHIPVYPFKKNKCLVEIPDVYMQEESIATSRTSANSTYENATKKSTINKINKFKHCPIRGKMVNCDENLAQTMANIWCYVLGTQEVELNDNFYTLGGDSIFAMKFVAEIKENLGVNISVKDAFINQTFEEITRFVNEAYKQLEVSKEGNENTDISSADIDETDNKSFVLKSYGAPKQYEMTNSQKGIFVTQMVNPNSTAYNMFNAIKVVGKFDQAKFLQCVNEIIAKQDSIRTNYVSVDGHFMAVVKDTNEVCVKASHYEVPDLEKENIKKCAKSFIRPFNLQNDLLIRIGFVNVKSYENINENETVILFDIHHIACDGMSTGVLIKQVYEKYFKVQELDVVSGNETTSDNKFEITYSDYACSVNDYELTMEYKEKEDELVEKLSGAEMLKIPTDFPRNNEEEFVNSGNKISFDLSKAESEQIKTFVKNKKITAFQFFIAMFEILLSKYSGQKDIVVGVPTAGRNDVRLESLVGLFINTLAIRNEVDDTKSCEDYLKDVAATVLDTYDKQCVSFSRIVERLELKQDENLGHNPLFDVMFSMQNFNHELLSIGETHFSNADVINEVSKLDITMNVSEHDNVFNVEIEYSTRLFMEETIQRMLDNYHGIVVQCLNEPDKKIQDLELSQKELELLAKVENNTVAFDKKKTLKTILENSSEKLADKTALVYENNKITYRSLNNKANYLAKLLMEQHGIKPKDRVAILCERSIEMVIAMLACVKAGVTYLPLDPDYPEDRLCYILEDSQTKCVIRYNTKKVWENDKKLDNIKDIVLSDIALLEISNFDTTFEANIPMYMIYTSGSTGLPKGVTITQANVCNFILGMNESIGFNKEEKIISVTTIGFDIFVLESFMALSNGMEIEIASVECINDMDKLCQKIIEGNIDIIQTTPSRIRVMMISDYFDTAACCLKKVLVGGEPFPKDFLRLLGKTSAKIFNVYGPTETTVWSTVGELTDSSYVHVGKPIANTRCFVLNDKKDKVPYGCVGELAIGGYGVSNGYYNREKLNKEKFVDLVVNELSSINSTDATNEKTSHEKERFFLTGDLAFWNNEGNLIIVGRNDRMVKLNGYRIELDEIQNVIGRIECVKEASVFVKGEDYLVACVSPKGSNPIDEKDLYQQIKNQLPRYMIPNNILVLKELPHTPNGKLDNKKLKVMAESGELFDLASQLKSSNTGDMLDESNKILSIWQKVLKLPNLTIEDDVFENGANSLKVIEFIAYLKKTGIDIVINDVFSNPTVEALDAYIKTKKNTNLLKDADKIESLVLSELGIKVKILCKTVEDQKFVFYGVESLEDFEKNHKKDLLKLLSKEVAPSHYVTHFIELEQISKLNSKTLEIEDVLKKRNLTHDATVIDKLLMQCKIFEEEILAMDFEKEYRMAAIQHYFLDSERYSGTMITFYNLLDIDVFNETITRFVNEQELFRANVVKHGNKLFWRVHENIKNVKIPFADLSAFSRESQFEIVNDICKNIYFKEYEQIRNIYDSSIKEAVFEGLLYRMLLIKISESEFYLILPVNHAIFDAMSGEIVKRRILDIYNEVEKIESAEDESVNNEQSLNAKNKISSINSINSYQKFVDQTRLGPVDITENGLEKLFEVDRYDKAVCELEKSISKYKKDNITYIRLEMQDVGNHNQNDNNAWSSAFEVLRIVAKDFLQINDMPFMIYYYGRKYANEEYFDTVGEFIDMIPMTASVNERSSQIQIKTQEVIENSERYNVNFSTLALHTGKSPLENLEEKIEKINNKTSIVFNFQGKLEKSEMGVFEKFLYNRLMQELNEEEAHNIHVMTRYSNDKIQMDINLPFEVNDDSIQKLLAEKCLALTKYEQKILNKS